MSDNVNITKLNNGLTILTQHMPGVNSVAFSFKLPCGSSFIDSSNAGAGSVLAEWLFRGTQQLTNKELIGTIESLGIHRNSSCGESHINLTGACEASNLYQGLKLYSQMILNSRFDAEEFDLSCETVIQSLIALDDDPRQKVMLKLKELFYPEPFNRNPMGTIDSIKSLSSKTAADIFQQNLDLSKVIIAVAGNFEQKKLTELLENLFAVENAAEPKTLDTTGKTAVSYTHIHHPGTQLHIGLICPSATILQKHYYNALAASAVLGGGMSSRLFTEVREKRGLCYAVGAKYQGLKYVSGISCYAGTTPEKAQETLKVIMDEFKKLKDGVSQDELDRAKVGMKGSLIMASESSSSRASSLGLDYYLLQRVRGIEEIKQSIDNITVESVLEYLNNQPLENFTICSIGPEKMDINL